MLDNARSSQYSDNYRRPRFAVHSSSVNPTALQATNRSLDLESFFAGSPSSFISFLIYFRFRHMR